MNGLRWGRKLFSLLLAMILLAGMTAVSTAAPTNSPIIRIGLMTKQFGILASCNGGYQIVNVDDGKVLGEYPAGT